MAQDERKKSCDSHGTARPLKPSKPKRLYINRRCPGRGPAAFWALCPSLILAPVRLWLRGWKRLRVVGLREHFGWDLFRLHLLTLHYEVSMATGACFSVTCEGAVPHSLSLSGNCATSFLVDWMGSAVSQSLCDMHRVRCPRPASNILKPRILQET